jgi:hypothetical protein
MRLLIALLIAASAFGAAGDIAAIRVVNTTAVAGTALSACLTASACTGWVAEIDVDGLSAGGTYALGIGANNSPATAKIACTVTSSGYDATAALGTTTRTVYGTHQLRKVYDAAHTAPYPNDETVAGATLTLRVALSDAIYSGDTLACDVGAGIYTEAGGDGGTATNAATGVVVTNNSALTYSQARVIANWSWPGYSRITGTTHTLRAVGFHRHAKNGKPLAAMKFTCSDAGAAHTATAVVTDMTIDSGMADAVKVPEYIGTLDLTGFTQGSLVTCNFAAYPWVGDATSVMDTSDGVNTMPTPNYAPQYYVYDAANTYGSPIAVVDIAAGNDTNNCAAVNTTDPATIQPCATVKGAVLDIRALNVATNAAVHSDVNGTVYLKAGTYPYTGLSTSVSSSTGTLADAEWVTITPYPGVSRASVIFDVTTSSGNRAGAATVKQKISGVTINMTAGTTLISGGSYVWFHNCSLTHTVSASGAMVNGTAGGVAYYTHNTVGAGGVTNGFTSYSSVYAALVRGNDVSELLNSVYFFTVLGNVKAPSGAITTGAWNSSDATTPIAAHPIFAYNKWTNVQIGGASAVALLNSASTSIGGAMVQNLVELNTTGASASVHLGAYASGTTNNILSWHNNIIGQRVFWAYNDVGSTFRLRTLWSEVGQIYDGRAIKSDTFGSSAARLGNWFELYGAGSVGNIDASTRNGADTVAVIDFKPEFYGIYGKGSPAYASTQYAAQPISATTTQESTYLAFVSRAAFEGGTTVGAGNGDYHLTASSPALNMIPSGYAVLPYDLDGVARRNDGTGAAGAYEYPTAAASTRKRVVVVTGAQ